MLGMIIRITTLVFYTQSQLLESLHLISMC